LTEKEPGVVEATVEVVVAVTVGLRCCLE